jgi:protein SCO1/2
VFVIAIAVGYELVLLALLLLPSSSEFAEGFRTSCFGFDPDTGLVSWILVFTTFAVPFIAVLVASIVWWQELRVALQAHRQAAAGYVGLGFAFAVVIGATLPMAIGTPPISEQPLPTVALRTEFPAPAFVLNDHAGRTLQLADLRGQVVLVTAIFSRCGYSCPMILSDIQNAVETLTPEQIRDLRIAVITLDPENDTPDVLAAVADARDFASPPYHLLTGEPTTVENVLDDFAIPRVRDAETGFIDHANLVFLIDREGLIAFRFTLEERHKSWLGSALRLLLGER